MSLSRNVSLRQALRYQGKGPMLTYILLRIGGLGIVIFVALHIIASFLMNTAWGSNAGIFINTISCTCINYKVTIFNIYFTSPSLISEFFNNYRR